MELFKKQLLAELSKSHQLSLAAHIGKNQVRLASPCEETDDLCAEEVYWRGYYQGILNAWNLLHSSPTPSTHPPHST